MITEGEFSGAVLRINGSYFVLVIDGCDFVIPAQGHILKKAEQNPFLETFRTISYMRRRLTSSLSYWVKTTTTDSETGSRDSSYRTYVRGQEDDLRHDDKTDYCEILGKPQTENDEMDLGMKILLLILFVVGVGFLVIGLDELQCSNRFWSDFGLFLLVRPSFPLSSGSSLSHRAHSHGRVLERRPCRGPCLIPPP